MHYTTLGKPAKDASGRTTNAVLVLHGTGGSGRGLLRPIFAGVLFGPGQLLDATRYFIILPDNIGHGKSSKPSDGMHAHFPQYDYADMIALQHATGRKGPGCEPSAPGDGHVDGLHAFLDVGRNLSRRMDALMPLACLPVQIAGRNRLWRKMVDRRNSPGPGLEERRLHQPASRSAADRGGFPVDRRRRASPHAGGPAHARCRRQVPRRIHEANHSRAGRQRFSLRRKRFTKLRSVVQARHDQGAA